MDYDASGFNHFMKFCMIDLVISTLRTSSTYITDERIVLLEIVVALLKYFGNIIDLTSFKW
jgi:hypothetical protein